MSTVLNLFVRSPDTRSERRIDPHWTVRELKSKLETVTGIPTSSQSISLFRSEFDLDSSSSAIAHLDDDDKKLGFYGVSHDYMVLKIDDLNPSDNFTGQLTDTSQVDKFELTDEAYAQRSDSVLAYKQRNKMGRFADQKPQDPSLSHVSSTTDPDISSISIGSRCQVTSTEPGLSKRGTVRFCGHTNFGTEGGIWVGVEYDEPMGKNDGSVQGKRYFSCQPNYGVFVRPDKVTVGDFPVEDLDLEDEEM